MYRVAIVTLGCMLASTQGFAAPPSARAIQLRNQGIAELENEAPVPAEATFRELVRIAPDDPLPYANLAIALLRQQRLDEARGWVGKALVRSPGEPHLLAIEAEIHHWSGNSGDALAAFRRAADSAPDAVTLQYSLYRQATSMNDPDAGDAAAAALTRLATLRPENLVVLLQLGQRARTKGDRPAATRVYLRIRELIWQAPPGADKLLDQILDGLESGELDALRSSALRLENVLKISPMYKEGLRELTSGIQGDPITTFRGEPEVTTWGQPAPVTFKVRSLATNGTTAAALAVGDLDGDEVLEIARLAMSPQRRRLEIRSPDETIGVIARVDVASDHQRLLLADLDNDGRQEIIAYGASEMAVFSLADDGHLQSVTPGFGVAGVGGNAATVIDFDIEGDLDLFLAGDTLRLLRNALDGPLIDVAAKSLPTMKLPAIRDALASDLDRDGDLDLLLAHERGLTWLDNLRQGRFADRSGDLPAAGAARRIASADFDNDGLPDLVTGGQGLRIFRNSGGRFTAWDVGGLGSITGVTALAVFDADNDGRLDFVVGGADGITVLAQRDGRFDRLPLDDALGGITALAVADVDSDGDLDILADGGKGLHLLSNNGGNRNRYLSVQLRGLNKGNSKNNVFGLGSAVEVKSGSAYQFREADGDTVHFGLGSVAKPDLLRVIWTNGVPQNRLQPETNQRIVEEQQLKGSCPFLYVKGEDGFRFVTDLLWGAPIGLPISEGVFLGADPQELVLIEGAPSEDDHYELRITEELWEAAFFDYLRLWVVEHPADVEVASSLKIQPGEMVDERVHGSRDVRSVARAWDASARDVSDRIRRRDGIYADGWEPSAYQGVAREPWTFTFDLGAAPARPIRLLL
ncbi:MAG: FG-GAP-like repeat-containing protein, partial [Acidobacteriota bacterium]|nr:FG-GAP-like repeat-containing protein [Acidobacteriota bacterium]